MIFASTESSIDAISSCSFLDGRYTGNASTALLLNVALTDDMSCFCRKYPDTRRKYKYQNRNLPFTFSFGRILRIKDEWIYSPSKLKYAVLPICSLLPLLQLKRISPFLSIVSKCRLVLSS